MSDEQHQYEDDYGEEDPYADEEGDMQYYRTYPSELDVMGADGVPPLDVEEEDDLQQMTFSQEESDQIREQDFQFPQTSRVPREILQKIDDEYCGGQNLDDESFERFSEVSKYLDELI